MAECLGGFGKACPYSSNAVSLLRCYNLGLGPLCFPRNYDKSCRSRPTSEIKQWPDEQELRLDSTGPEGKRRHYIPSIQRHRFISLVGQYTKPQLITIILFVSPSSLTSGSPRVVAQYSSAMATVFPRFPNFPVEVRTAIWEMAVRSDEPGVHFFTIGNGPRPPRPGEPESDSASKVRDPVLLGPPALAPNTDKSWVNGNPTSAYVFDAGMWTACRHSRQVIKSHQEERERSAPDFRRLLRLGRSWCGVDDRTFVVFHRHDLICLKQLDERSLDEQAENWKNFSVSFSQHLTF